MYVVTPRCMCCCCCSCGVVLRRKNIHVAVLNDASQIDYCRYWGRASLPPITSRLRSGYECCCCCCCSAAAARCVIMLYGSHAKAVNRRHRGAMCSVCVGRAVRSACVAPKPKARQVFSLTGRVCSRKKKAHRAPASACCSSRQSTRRCHRFCICTLPTLRCMTLPAFAAASCWHGLATRAMPSLR